MARLSILLFLLAVTVTSMMAFPQYGNRWNGNNGGRITGVDLVDPGFAGPTGSSGNNGGGVQLVDPGFAGPTGSSHGGLDPGFAGPTQNWQGNNGGIIDPGFAGPGTPGRRYNRRYYK